MTKTHVDWRRNYLAVARSKATNDLLMWMFVGGVRFCAAAVSILYTATFKIDSRVNDVIHDIGNNADDETQ